MEYSSQNNNLTPRMSRILNENSVAFAKLKNRNIIFPQDILVSILNDSTGLGYTLIKLSGANLDALKFELGSINVSSKDNIKDDAVLHGSSIFILEKAEKIASNFSSKKVGTEHVILSCLTYKNRDKTLKTIKTLLNKYGVFSDDYANAIKYFNDKSEVKYPSQHAEAVARKKRQNSRRKEENEKKQQEDIELDLPNFLKNVNEKVRNSEDNFIGREDEIKKLIRVLSRKDKNNAIIIGGEGVGKTALVEGLARYIEDKKAPENMLNTVIYSLDIGAIVAGTKYRGQFEERMKVVLNFFKTESKLENKVLFVDEIHQIINAGSAEGSIDASAMIKPKLTSGEIQCIGATTLKEYKKYVLPHGPLVRRFRPVFLDEPNTEYTLEILKGIKPRYEEFHKIHIEDEELKYIVNLCDTYMKDRNFPDKAIDILDESCVKKTTEKTTSPEIVNIEKEVRHCNEKLKELISEKNFEKCNEVKIERNKLISKRKKLSKKFKEENNLDQNGWATLEREEICEIVTEFTGIPLAKNSEEEKQKLLKMNDEINKVVIGQSEPIDEVCRTIKRSRSGIKDPDRPSGVVLLLGGTGVGKTMLIKELAKHHFGSADKIIRIDMSEYMEKNSVTKLIGASPGYVGYEDGGVLTEKVREKPYSIVLFDEIEKAHEDVFNLFLQIFDEGRLSDSYQNTIDFRNVIIAMTSNIGVKKLEEKNVGFHGSRKSKKDKRKTLIDEVKKRFSPEFFNRIDSVVVFDDLEKEDVSKIFDLEFNKITNRIKDKNISIKINPTAKKFLMDKGYNQTYGARPMKRTLQRFIEDELADRLISEEIFDGCKVSIGHKKNEDHLSFTVTKPKKS